MNDPERAFERLRRANPEPSPQVEDKPTASEMLAMVRQEQVGPSPDRNRPRVAPALAAAVLVLVVGVPLLLFLSTSGKGPAATSPTTTPDTVLPDNLDPTAQTLVELFVSAYNKGDQELFAELLHPDFRREEIVERDIRTQPLETVLARYEIDVALHTEITLTCTVGAADAVCSRTRYDDLHRVLGIPPSDVPSWSFTFEDGLVRTWSETRPNQPTAYAERAVAPFADWVVANTELDARTFEQRYFSGGSSDWVVRDGIVDDLSALVAQWAADLGE